MSSGPHSEEAPNKINVLVVDDEPEMLELVEEQLSESGIVNVLVSETVEEALKHVEIAPIDVVLSDVTMPGGGGKILIDRIQKTTGKIPSLFFVTAGDMSAAEAYDRGCDAIFRKPINFTDLLAGIKHFAGIKNKRLKAERTVRHQQESLKMASKMATLGETTSCIAHEIKGHVAALNDIVKEQIEESPNVPHLKSMSELIERISDNIQSISAYSRNSTNDKSEPLNPVNILKKTIQLTKKKALFSNVKVECECDPNDAASINGRESELLQILVNLINNAIDALEDSHEKWLRLSLESNGNHAVFRVRDSGPGIPKSERAKIFESFFTTKPPGKGTGLGLSISKQIATNHGGDLFINDECENTEFVLEIPRSQMKQAA